MIEVDVVCVREVNNIWVIVEIVVIGVRIMAGVVIVEEPVKGIIVVIVNMVVIVVPMRPVDLGKVV